MSRRKSMDGMVRDLDKQIEYLEMDDPYTETSGSDTRKNTKVAKEETGVVVMDGRMVRVHTMLISILVTAIVVAVAAAILTWQFAESQNARVDAVRGATTTPVVEEQK